MGKIITPDIFWSKVQKTKSCWNWMGYFTNGYGQIQIGVPKMAHRVAYELTKGKIPEGLTIDHLCRNKKCVNPNHLEAVTNKENVLRGIGITAKNAKKTHCPRGHPLSGDNLMKSKLKNGGRACRMCSNMLQNIRKRSG